LNNLRNARTVWGEQSPQYLICKNTAEMYLQNLSPGSTSNEGDGIMEKMQSLALSENSNEKQR